MKRFLYTISLLIFAVQAHASLLTFDDVPGGSIQNSSGDILTYNGFNISSNMGWIDTVGSNWNYGAYSGDFAMLNYRGFEAQITEQGGLDFSFDGLLAKLWGTSVDSAGLDKQSGYIQGYNDGTLIWSVELGLNGTYEYYAAQSGLIDTLTIGNVSSLILVDNLALNEVASVPVPVPGSCAILGIGLLGFGYSKRKNSI